MKRKFLFLFFFCVSLSSFAGGEWFYQFFYQSSVDTVNFQSGYTEDFISAQINAFRYMPLYRRLSASNLYLNYPSSVIVSNSVSGVYTISGANIQSSAPSSINNGLPIYSLLYSLIYTGWHDYNYDPAFASQSVVSNDSRIVYVRFRPFDYISGLYLSNPSFRADVLNRLSSLDTNVSNILSHVISVGGDISSLASYASIVSSNVSDILSSVDSISDSVSPDWSVQSGLLNSQLFKGRYNSSMLPATLQNHFVSGAVLQPADDIGTAYLNNWYNAFKNGTSDSFVDFWRMAGVSVSEDGNDYSYDSTASNLNFGNRTISLSDYMGASPFQQSSFKSAVQRATNTNSVQRIGQEINKSLGSASRQLGSISNTLDTLNRPRSAENQEKRELDAQANAQAIKQALANNNNSLFNVHVSNWPDDGIKVDFDDQELNIGFNASAGSAVSSIKDEIKNLVDDFREWSGVEDGGNNLVIQDNIATNMGLIVGSLVSLTNSYLSNTNTYPYGQYTALQSTNDQDNARSYISSVQSELSRYRDFNAEDYISWGLSSYMNPSDRSDWNALRLMCINARMPDYITLVIPEFGSFGPWNLRVPTAPVVRIVSVSRFCCRMTYLFILLWIAAWCFRRYRDILDTLRDAFGLKGPMQVS